MSKGGTCEAAHLDHALMNIADAATRDVRAAEGREQLEDKLRTLYARVEPRRKEALMEWDYYWKRQPDVPFATLIRVSATYLHPEADHLESLQELVKSSDRPEMRVFKTELRQAITHLGQLRATSSTTTSSTTEATRSPCDGSGGLLRRRAGHRTRTGLSRTLDAVMTSLTAWTAIRICPVTATKSTPWPSQTMIGFAGHCAVSLR